MICYYSPFNKTRLPAGALMKIAGYISCVNVLMNK